MPAVDDDLHRPRQLDVGGDAAEVGLGNIVGLVAAVGAALVAVAQIVLFQPNAQLLDGVARQGLAADDHFEAVVVRRVVRAGDHDAGIRVELIRCEVGHRRGDHAQVDHIDAGFLDATRQGGGQFRPGQAAVATDAEGGLAAGPGLAADSLADGLDDFGGEGFADDAADVVGLEDFLGEIHGEFGQSMNSLIISALRKCHYSRDVYVFGNVFGIEAPDCRVFPTGLPCA